MLDSQNISIMLSEAMYRLSYLKREAETQIMFKSAKESINKLKRGSFCPPRLDFLKKSQDSGKMKEEPLSPVSASSSLSTRCSSTEGEETFNFEDLVTKTESPPNPRYLKSSKSLNLDEKDSVTGPVKIIKKLTPKPKTTLKKARNLKRRYQTLKLRRNKLVSQGRSKSKPVRKVRQDQN